MGEAEGGAAAFAGGVGGVGVGGVGVGGVGVGGSFGGGAARGLAPQQWRVNVGWKGEPLSRRRAAAERLRAHVSLERDIAQGVAEVACRQRVVREIADGTKHELQALLALGLNAATRGFLDVLIDAILTPLATILIYLLVLYLVIMIGFGLIAKLMSYLVWVMPLALALTLGPATSNVLVGLLTYCLKVTLSDAVSDMVVRSTDMILIGNMAQTLEYTAGPAIAHKVAELSTRPITYALSRSLTTDLTYAISHGLTHAVTHAIIHKYYCEYCFGYHEYCQYCFYYNDYTWLHRLWSTGISELTPGGLPVGNQFGGSVSHH